MTRWHPSVEAAKAEAEAKGIEPYTVIKTHIEDREVDMPVVWYRCEARRNNG